MVPASWSGCRVTVTDWASAAAGARRSAAVRVRSGGVRRTRRRSHALPGGGNRVRLRGSAGSRSLDTGVNVLAISSLLASLVILAIGASVLLRDRTRRTYTSFAAFTFMVSAWHLCNFIAMATKEPLVEWLALWPAATIPPVALRFFREFLAEPSIGGVRRPPRVSLVWTIAAYLALLYSPIFGPVHDQLYFQVPFAAYVYGSLYRCVYELYLQYRHTAGRVARTRIRYLMIGGLVAITLAMTDSLDRFGV